MADIPRALVAPDILDTLHTPQHQGQQGEAASVWKSTLDTVLVEAPRPLSCQWEEQLSTHRRPLLTFALRASASSTSKPSSELAPALQPQIRPGRRRRGTLLPLRAEVAGGWTAEGCGVCL